MTAWPHHYIFTNYYIMRNNTIYSNSAIIANHNIKTISKSCSFFYINSPFQLI